MDITVPHGCAGGSAVEFTDANGRALSAIVPDGLVEGDAFRVELPPADFMDEILDALTEERFVALLDGFIERECHHFLLGGAGEYTLEQTTAHQNYVRFYESRIEAHIKRHGLSSDDFLTALMAAEAKSGSVTRVSVTSLASSLMLVQDFSAFAKLAQQRAIERAG